ncbi:unnamed protein product [Tuber melanosporum]|jgi:DASH complex subunit DAD3|uniref:DASH complex subunit DAD3 n=1 Tax=Tuber melanosporum (strain Mel28) TaxID=656061 RepID=D5GMR9_TUBMM|nr:uncharacterized protein GSTUM_00010902001 [Tuber melanosporum]CAZ85812.1 unnamed protein product [Tuber melanosporum]
MSTTPPHHSPVSGPGLLTPLEQEILDEYTRLLHNMNNLSTSIAAISGTPTAKILDSLRGLERKTGLVFTLLKASVYSMVLQQQLDVEGREGEGGGGDGGEGYGKEKGEGEDESRLG